MNTEPSREDPSPTLDKERDLYVNEYKYEYIQSMLEQLRIIAEKSGDSLLVYLLDLARFHINDQVNPQPLSQHKDTAVPSE